jgi:WD40 repeat protein
MSSTNDELGEGIIMTKLKGHQGSVLCLDLSSPIDHPTNSPSTLSLLSSTKLLLLSGSEDHTARLWDLREHRRRACLCVQTSGDVLSAMFAPNRLLSVSDSNTTSTANRHLLSPFALDFTIYLAVENTVLEYDLRHSQAPVVRHEATRNWGTTLQHQDEVNQISLAYGCVQMHQQPSCRKRHKKAWDNRKTKNSNDTINSSSNSLYLAACDDAGTIRFVDLHGTATSTTSTILHHDPDGVAIVPTCAIRPRSLQKNGKVANGGLELASGGSDCKIHLWDLSKPKCVDRIASENVLCWISVLNSYFLLLFVLGDRHRPLPQANHLLSKMTLVVRASLKYATLLSFIL